PTLFRSLVEVASDEHRAALTAVVLGGLDRSCHGFAATGLAVDLGDHVGVGDRPGRDLVPAVLARRKRWRGPSAVASRQVVSVIAVLEMPGVHSNFLPSEVEDGSGEDRKSTRLN